MHAECGLVVAKTEFLLKACPPVMVLKLCGLLTHCCAYAAAHLLITDL